METPMKKATETTAGGRPRRRPACRCVRLGSFNCPRTSPFDALGADLVAQGYGSHHDPVDAEVIARRQWFTCLCGRQLVYVGLARPGSYRAFAVCRRCGHWCEV